MALCIHLVTCRTLSCAVSEASGCRAFIHSHVFTRKLRVYFDNSAQVKMETVIDCVLRTSVAARQDVFGEEALFVLFKPDPIFGGSDGYKSNLLFCRIVYRKNKSERMSPPLLLKLTPEPPPLFPELNMFEFTNEIVFYTKLFPVFASLRHIDHLFPKFYASQLNVTVDAFHAAVVFENLRAAGYVALEKKTFLAYDRLALMLRKLGEFHAYSYAARQENPDRFLTLVNSFAVIYSTSHWRWRDFLPRVGLRGLQPLENDVPYSHKVAKLTRMVESADEFMAEVMNDKGNPVAVLCHGDYLPSNVLFQLDEDEKPLDMKIIDMATCKLASPVVDLALVLYLSTDQRMRDKHWDDLIDEYYTALSETFPQCEVPAKDEIVRDFRSKAMSAYHVASFFLPILIAEDNNLPSFFELLPPEYRGQPLDEVPVEAMNRASADLGGELATEALADILRDMVNRGFV